tara:strand:- start:702 stop:1151 length:450 start_codon:yes stop_codon:yes gene_type:complete
MFKETSLYKEIVIKGKNKNKNFVPGTKVYKGISSVNVDNVTVNLYDLALIKQDIINHFHIRQGEKLSDPTFGTIIWDLLFDPLTPSLRDLIIQNVNDIIQSDPRVKVDSVIIDEYESGIQIECNLIYLPYNIQESMQLNFDKNAGFLSI